MMLWKYVHALLSIADMFPLLLFFETVYQPVFSKTMDGLYRSVFWSDELENVPGVGAKSQYHY